MTTYILSLSLMLLTTNMEIKNVVHQFHELKTEDEEVEFIIKYNYSTDPSILAYVVSIEMKQAEYSNNPYVKLKVFNTNRNRLDSLIEKHNSNIHLRYIRLVVQENTPRILGYNDFIEEDQIFLKNKLEVSDETDYLDRYIKANTSL